MVDSCGKQFWIKKISDFFCTLDIIPTSNKTLEEQCNALSRLAFLVFIILLVFDFNHAFAFFVLSFTMIILLYFIKRRSMKETFKMKRKEHSKPRSTESSQRFCDKIHPIDYNGGPSSNQMLAGPPNPKTLRSPIVAPPTMDLDYWKASNLVTHSHINAETQFPDYLSGYKVSQPCVGSELRYSSQDELHYSSQDELVEGRASEQSMGLRPSFGDQQQLKEGFHRHLQPTGSDYVNRECSYNPENIEFGMPVNYPAGNCTLSPNMREYNFDLNTQTLQPNVYTRSQVNEPVMSNLGISYAQQLLPMVKETDQSTGSLTYIRENPLTTKEDNSPTYEITVNQETIFDPRHTGYGTSYRSYTEPMTGQTRFYYKDVDAVKMPNYITRNNIDFTSFGDSYGPIPSGGAHGNPDTYEIRKLANDAFLNNTLDFRNEMMEAAMRKSSYKTTQQRRAPIHTNGFKTS